MSNHLYNFNLSRCALPDTTKDACAFSAVSTTTSSFGSATTITSLLTAGITISQNDSYIFRNSSGRNPVSLSMGTNFFLDNTCESSSSRGKEVTADNVPHDAAFNISYGAPCHRKPEITTFVSRTTRIDHYRPFSASFLRTARTSRAISSSDIGGLDEGISAGQILSWICLSIIVSPLCEKRNRSPFLSMARYDRGILNVPVFLFALTVTIELSPFLFQKYTNKPSPGSTLGPDPFLELSTDNFLLSTH